MESGKLFFNKVDSLTPLTRLKNMYSGNVFQWTVSDRIIRLRDPCDRFAPLQVFDVDRTLCVSENNGIVQPDKFSTSLKQVHRLKSRAIFRRWPRNYVKTFSNCSGIA